MAYNTFSPSLNSGLLGASDYGNTLSMMPTLGDTSNVSGLNSAWGSNLGLGGLNNSLDLSSKPAGLSGIEKGFGLGTQALQGLGSMASLFTAFKSLGLAKQDLALKKQSQETNLNNQVQSYNTALSDRIKGRASQNGNMSAQDQQDYINKNSVSKAAL